MYIYSRHIVLTYVHQQTLEDLEALVKLGKVTTDYETGELNAPAALGDLTASLAAAAAAKAEDAAQEKEEREKEEGDAAAAAAAAGGEGDVLGRQKGGKEVDAAVGGGAKGGPRSVKADAITGGGGDMLGGTGAAAASSSSLHSHSTTTTTAAGAGADKGAGGDKAGATREQEVAAAVEKLQAAADPARLHLDVALLRDVVLMSVATALGGFAATVARLPPATGYMAAGMLIGPSGLNLIQNLGAVETLGAFGSIFLLFGHGLMYCAHYGGGLGIAGASGVDAAAAIGAGAGAAAAGAGMGGGSGGGGAAALAHSLSDTFVAGVLILSAIFFMTILAFTLLAGGAHFYQATLVASAVALSSTTTTAHALAANRLRETAYGKALIELMAVQVGVEGGVTDGMVGVCVCVYVLRSIHHPHIPTNTILHHNQDLLMAPLLSIPTAVKELLYEYGIVYMLPILLLYSGALAAAALLSKRLIPKVGR